MNTLNFNLNDVINSLLSLKVEHYLETVLDDKPNEVLPFYAFIKMIEHRDVYIKLKVRHNAKKAYSVYRSTLHAFQLKTNYLIKGNQEKPW